jgi:hypothetical protein
VPELVSLRVAAEVVVVVEDQDPGALAVELPEEVGRGKPADTATDDDEVVGAVAVALFRGIPPRPVAKLVGDLERTGMGRRERSREAAGGRSDEVMATETPFRKSRREMARPIPSSRSRFLDIRKLPLQKNSLFFGFSRSEALNRFSASIGLRSGAMSLIARWSRGSASDNSAVSAIISPA